MYTTPQQCHVALDYELQQISSNRKQSIDPRYYDMALNEGVLQFIETRTSNKSNVKHEGFEETQKRYDDLKDLKRQLTLRCITDVNYYQRSYIILPGNYLKYTSSEVTLSYSKQGFSSIVELPKVKYVIEYDLSKLVYPFQGSFKVVLGSTEIDLSTYIATIKTSKGKFYAINLILDTLRTIGYDTYYESYNGTYKQERLIIVSDSSITPITTDSLTPVRSTISYSVFDNTNAQSPTNQSSVDLLSTNSVRDILNNYHNNRNRHQNPIADIIGDHFNVYYSNTFLPLNIIFNYIKRPRLIDIGTGSMCEIIVPQEVIKLAVIHLKGILKDEGYNISANEKIINE